GSRGISENTAREQDAFGLTFLHQRSQLCQPLALSVETTRDQESFHVAPPDFVSPRPTASRARQGLFRLPRSTGRRATPRGPRPSASPPMLRLFGTASFVPSNPASITSSLPWPSRPSPEGAALAARRPCMCCAIACEAA